MFHGSLVWVGSMLNVPLNNFLSFWDGANAFWVLPVLLGVNMLCSAQGHNTATRVGLEPPDLWIPNPRCKPARTHGPRRYGSTKMTICFSRSGLAQWLAPRATDQGVPGSRPGRGTVCCGLEQIIFTHCLVLVKHRKPWTDDWHGLTVTRLETTLCLMC